MLEPDEPELVPGLVSVPEFCDCPDELLLLEDELEEDEPLCPYEYVYV